MPNGQYVNGFSNGLKYYKPIHFRLEELLPRNIFEARGDRGWELLDWRIVYSVDCIREYLNIPITINDWIYKGKQEDRGFRPPDCNTGVAFSQHKFGRAVDFISKEMNSEEIRLKIIQASRLFPFITYMENDTPHVHIDCRLSAYHGIHLFSP